MEYTNSNLITCTKLSPNYTNDRKCINRITIHHTATSPLTALEIGNIFATTARGASCSYGIGNDGSKCLIVPEMYRPWTSSNPTNDRMAITYEVSNSKYGEPWAISAEAMEAVIALSVDICQRYGIKEVFNIHDEIQKIPQSQRAAYANNYVVPEGKLMLTEHNFFSSTACPGTFLKGQMNNITAEINRRLGVSPTPVPTPTTSLPTPVLKRGSKGAEVVKLQKQIMSMGIALPRYGADGDFGAETENGVKEMQKKLFVNGVYDQRTADALKPI